MVCRLCVAEMGTRYCDAVTAGGEGQDEQAAVGDGSRRRWRYGMRASRKVHVIKQWHLSDL